MAASGTGTASSGNPETENCSDIRLLLSALADNEALPDEAARAKAHMASCADCASHFAFLRLTGKALSQIPDVYPSASLSARIAAATYEKPTLAERIAGWLRPAPVRVGFGAALATGLAMAFIVPRMGEVNTATVPPVPTPAPAERGVSVAKDKPAAKAGTKVTRPVLSAKPETVPVASVPKTGTAKTETSIASNLPPVKPSVSNSAPAPPAPKTKAAPVMVAKAPSDKTLQSLAEASAHLSASDVVRTTRTGPQMDRNRNPRTLGNGLKKPGTGNITLPRSGYDRAAETESRLKPRENVASATPSVAAVPNIAPLVPENSGGKLAEPNNGIGERPGSRLPTASAESALIAVAEAPTGTLRYHMNSRKPSGTESFSTAGLNRGGGSSTGDKYSFASGSAARISISSAPVTGTN